MKKILYIAAFIAFATQLTSCTADEIPTTPTNQDEVSTMTARDGEEIDPPKVTTPPPPPPPPLPVTPVGK